MARHVLLAEDASNGLQSAMSWDGGDGVLHAQGTWDGATVTLRYAPYGAKSGLTMVEQSTDLELTESQPVKGFNSIPGGNVRVNIAGGSGSESLTVTMSR